MFPLKQKKTKSVSRSITGQMFITWEPNPGKMTPCPPYLQLGCSCWPGSALLSALWKEISAWEGRAISSEHLQDKKKACL